MGLESWILEVPAFTYQRRLALIPGRISHRKTLFLLLLLIQACGEIPDSVPTGSATVVDPFGFSILVDTSLVADGWTVREFVYSPAQNQRYRSVEFPLVYEMFIDRPGANGGRIFQPLGEPGPRVENGSAATRVIVRVLQYPGIPSFDALVDTVRNLNQTVTDVFYNGAAGKELSLSNGNRNNPNIYAWPHTEEMVPRIIFGGDDFLYFVNIFESRGNNADTTQVARALQTFQLIP